MIDVTAAWLPLRAVNAGLADQPLYCVPHAGGGASAFRTWLGRIPGIDVAPVQLPGREARIRETPYRSIAAIVQEITAVLLADAAGRPFSLYGHSLGALTAFEVARELRRRGLPGPQQLVVSGSASPQQSTDRGKLISTLPEPKLVQVLRKLGGTPEWVLNDPEVLAMILPAVRGDFAIREDYRYVQEPPLRTPITVISSDNDPRASHRRQTRWDEQTSASFRLHTLPGGHFAVFDRERLTLDLIAEALGVSPAVSR